MNVIKDNSNETLDSVCIISTVHPPHDQRIFHKQAKSLQNDGWEVSFIVHTKKNTVRDGVRLISLGEANNRLQRWSHLFRAYKKALGTEADIYHFHDPELLPVGYALKQQTDAAVVFDMHEDFVGNKISEGHRDWIPSTIQPIVTQIFPRVFSLFVSRIDAVITTTQSMANRVEELGANRVELVRNFPKIENINHTTDIIEKDHKYQLVYVGRLTEERGIMRMLQTLRRLQEDRDIGLWLLGTFVDKEEEVTAESYINRYDLNVRRFGYVEYNDVFPILMAADVGFVLLDSTLCEHNISTKMFEYMYTKTPYIGTNARTIRKYTDDNTGILVPEKDISAIVDAIEYLLDDYSQLQNMGENGHKRVITQYNWESEFEKLSDIYKDMITNNGKNSE
jgi:glycosyltransferase involved in cell wall biosynthesis